MGDNHDCFNGKVDFETCIEENASPSFPTKRKIESDNKLELHRRTNFEKKVKKMFIRKKFKLSNEFNQKNSEIFLKNKDECMKDVYLDDTIPNKKKKNLNYSKINKNYSKINSFYSIGSSNYVKEIIDLLK